MESVLLQQKHKRSLLLPWKYLCWWDNVCYLQILSIADMGLAELWCGHCSEQQDDSRGQGPAFPCQKTLLELVQPPGKYQGGQGRRENPNWDAIRWTLGGSGHLGLFLLPFEGSLAQQWCENLPKGAFLSGCHSSEEGSKGMQAAVPAAGRSS